MNSTLIAPARGYELGLTTQSREIDVESLPISGRIPDWLGGTLLRNGPARFEVGSEHYRHWFDGLAMIHRFTIGSGAVSYANRFLQTPAFLEAERTGHIVCAEFGTSPKRSALARLHALVHEPESANANVNIVPFAGDFLALTETPNPIAFDGRTLETKGVRRYDDQVGGQMLTAHTLYDRARRATFNVVTELGRSSSYKFVRIEDGTMRRTVVATIKVDRPAYLHAFSMTESSLILAEYPYVVRPLDLALRIKPFIENYRWEPARGTRFHVVRKDGGTYEGSFSAAAMFAFHHINAYDEAGSIVVDIAAYDDAAIVDDFSLERMRRPGSAIQRGSFRRYRLVPGESDARVETIATEATELPRIANASIGRPYRFAYGLDVPNGIFDRLVKVDAQARNVTSWGEPGTYLGEPVFVARPEGRDEDDGVVLCVALDGAAQHSDLLVLDARNLEELARAAVPQHIPFGFHGIFR